ncbi:MAG: 2-iminoacetate synthase [Syntrophus sp. PtaB.Bin001]|nr:MAG: 2-iminoacetate synthase [Syntrophus sp. PtaB.Bin001]
MSFYDVYRKYKNEEWDKLFETVSDRDIEQALLRDYINLHDFVAFLSPAAEQHLEAMAEKAQELTLRNFGRIIQLYAPIYVSDYCENFCLYCSFSAANRQRRKKLSLKELEHEAGFIADTGMQNILLLTGESRNKSPVSYIGNCVKVLRKRFPSIAIEVYPLEEKEYAYLVEEGVDGLTLYQETYDEAIYRVIHPAGPKRNFRFRLEAPERGAAARMRQINVGALLGLADWRKDALMVGLHARFLQDRFPDVEIGASVPRLRPHLGAFRGPCKVSDKNMVQIILALRLFIPRLAISLSTREDAKFRDSLVPLGITRLSAGSATSVGGYTISTNGDDNTLPQFELADTRGVSEIIGSLRKKGYEPVFKDWIFGI